MANETITKRLLIGGKALRHAELVALEAIGQHGQIFPVEPFAYRLDFVWRDFEDVIAETAEAGYDVLLPFGENLRYDLVIDDGAVAEARSAQRFQDASPSQIPGRSFSWSTFT